MPLPLSSVHVLAAVSLITVHRDLVNLSDASGPIYVSCVHVCIGTNKHELNVSAQNNKHKKCMYHWIIMRCGHRCLHLTATQASK